MNMFQPFNKQLRVGLIKMMKYGQEQQKLITKEEFLIKFLMKK